MAILQQNPNKPLEKLAKAAEDAAKPFHRDYWLNVAFYLGEQYVEWKADIENIRRIPRTEKTKHRPRPVVNKINHFVSQQHAFALQAKPTADVLPATDDASDISDSLVAKSYLDYILDTHQINFNRVLSNAVMWALVTGECFLKWYWNPVKNRPDVMVVSPFEGFVDPYATDFSQARYFVHRKFMDREAVFDTWGIEVPAGKAEKADPTRTQLLREMGSAPVLDGVTVKELWHVPSRRHPEGLYAVWAGEQQLVAPKPLPFKHKRLPFTQIGVVQRPGSVHYDSHVKYLRSPQMELNKYHAQRIRIRENFASPKWGYDAQLELEEPPNDDPDQTLIYNSQGGTLRPEIFQPAAMADNNEGAWITEEMMHVVGLHEVSQAQVPGRVEAAKAIELLKEADASRLSDLIDNIRDSIAEGCWQLLMLARQYVKQPEIVRSYSREGAAEVRRFYAQEFKPASRVRVSMGTGLARSRAARQDQILRMVELGLVKDPEQVAELMEVPVPTLLSARAFDVRLARNENYTMASTQAVKPNSWDDHEIHLREHNNFRKTHEYAELGTKAKQMFEFHCETHEKLQMKQLEKDALKMAIQQGAGLGGEAPHPEEGGPSANTAGQTAPGEAPDTEVVQ